MDFRVILSSGTEYKIGRDDQQKLLQGINDAAIRIVQIMGYAAGAFNTDNKLSIYINPAHVASFEQL
jgi:hypothetical protein